MRLALAATAQLYLSSLIFPPSASMAAEFSLRLQHGIAGGFAPATPDAIYTITGTPTQPDLHITSATRAPGTPALQLAAAAPTTLSAGDAEAQALLKELHDILATLPTETPPGSEDIYGMDIGLAYGSADLMWMNGGPQGCGGGTSTVQATAEEKVRFARAVEIVKELVGRAT